MLGGLEKVMLLDFKSEKNNHIAVYAFLTILFLQTVMMLFFCVNKQEYHIDEIYSYILSNSYHCDKIKNATEIKNRWISGEKTFNDFVSVQPGERFAYGKTYHNNTTDAHPPFYYFVLHTVCSFFPDTFSKWLGLSVNILTFVLTQLLLFLISRKLLSGIVWQLLPMTFYGFSPIAVDIVLFIRMYSLLTFFTVLLFYLHFRMYEGTLKYPYLWCFAVAFLGMFTQYLFAFSPFYLALSWCVILLRKKKYREWMSYAVSMLSGILLVFVCYPVAFRQATGSSTNNVGNEVSSNILNFVILPERIVSYAHQFLFRMTRNWKWLAFYMAVFAMIIILSVVFRKKEDNNREHKADNIKTGFKTVLSNALKKALKRKNAGYVFVTAIVIMLTVITVAHISGKFAYLRYIYNIMPVLFLLFIIICYYLSSKYNVNRLVLAVGMMSLALLIGANTVIKKNCDYLFSGRYQELCDTVEFLGDKPLVLIDKNKNHMLTGNLTLFTSVDQMYISDTDEINIDELTQDKDISDGVAFLVLNNTQWSDGYLGDETMQKIVDASEKFNTYEKYGGEVFSTMYWVY